MTDMEKMLYLASSELERVIGELEEERKHADRLACRLNEWVHFALGDKELVFAVEFEDTDILDQHVKRSAK